MIGFMWYVLQIKRLLCGYTTLAKQIYFRDD